MYLVKTALICALLTLSHLDPVLSRKSFGRGGGGLGGSHSYPKSGGLSGSSGSHSYPKSPGLSGNSGGSHGYPSSGGLSGGGSHGYPNSGGSGGLSGGGSGGYPNTHNHPANTHGYPASTGLSGNSRPGGGYPTQNNYHYNPPQQIHYAPSHGGPPVNYPVYHGTPPSYVYQYKDSGSKYGTLLTGLALLNLGTLGAVAYNQFGNSHSSSHGAYKAQPGEVCKFAVRKENGDYEETKIDCKLISSFILAEEAKQNATAANTTTTVTTTVTNVTTTNLNETANPGQESLTNLTVAGAETLYRMFPNGTLVPVIVPTDNATMGNVTTAMEGNATDEALNNTMTSTVTVTTTNTTVTNAVDVKGPPVEVTPGMKCYVIRSAPSSSMRKTVPCDLLVTYADKSIQKNIATRISPMISVFAVLLVSFVV